MSRHKFILRSVTYTSLALGVPLLLVLLISQSYPVWNSLSSSSSRWEIRTQLVTFAPDGQMLLASNSAFAVHKGQISLLTNYLPDRLSSQTTEVMEGQTFSSTSSNRYSLMNRQKTPAEIIMVQVFLPGTANLPTPTPWPTLSRGYSLQSLDQRFMDIAPGREELEKIALTLRLNLLKRG